MSYNTADMIVSWWRNFTSADPNGDPLLELKLALEQNEPSARLTAVDIVLELLNSSDLEIYINLDDIYDLQAEGDDPLLIQCPECGAWVIKRDEETHIADWGMCGECHKAWSHNELPWQQEDKE